MSKHVTTADFIFRAREVHGERYDYSKVVYLKARSKVTIICLQHGEFQQTPANHCTGHGCHECGGNFPLSLARFINRANKVHNNRFDYSRVKFKNVESEVEIICPEHGPFFQRMMNHLKGFGCSQCGWGDAGKKRSHSIERFLEDARRAHGDRYDYSQVKYVNAHVGVRITCPAHGLFIQKPAHHIRAVGCPKCGDESAAALRVRTTEEFINEAKALHGDKYDYSNVVYKTSTEKVEITCRVHGSFFQLPLNHVRMNPSGCPGCAATGFDQTKPGLLYYLAIKTNNGDTLYKIGITNLNIDRRFPSLDLARIRVVKIWEFAVGHDAASREAEILSQFESFKYYGSDVLVGAGNTELFTCDVLGLDNRENEIKQSTVDADANLISKPKQLNFEFF